MLTKFFLFLLISTLGYGITVFTAPEIASKIDSIVGIPGFSENIRGTKNNFDSIITDIPDINEFKSGALDIKETVIDGVATTKDTIDSVRGGAQKVEETYNQAVETYDSTKQAVDEANRKISEFQSIFNKRATESGSTIIEE